MSSIEDKICPSVLPKIRKFIFIDFHGREHLYSDDVFGITSMMSGKEWYKAAVIITNCRDAKPKLANTRYFCHTLLISRVH